MYPQIKLFLEGASGGGETTRIRKGLKITDPSIFGRRIYSRGDAIDFRTRELCRQRFWGLPSLLRGREGVRKTYQVWQRMGWKYFKNVLIVPYPSGLRWSPKCCLYRLFMFLSLRGGSYFYTIAVVTCGFIDVFLWFYKQVFWRYKMCQEIHNI